MKLTRSSGMGGYARNANVKWCTHQELNLMETSINTREIFMMDTKTDTRIPIFDK